MTAFSDKELQEMFLMDLTTTEEYFDFIKLKKSFESNVQIKCTHTRRIFDISKLNSYQCEHNFRFNHEELFRLYLALQISAVQKTSERHSFRMEGFCIVLRRMSYTSRWFDMVHLFRRDKTALCRIFMQMTNWIYDKCLTLLKSTGHTWLNQWNLENYAQAITRRRGIMTDVVGFIDGTTRQICRPSHNQKLYYSGHKRRHCIKFQAVTMPCGLITHLGGAYPGSRHDAAIFWLSGLRDKLEKYMRVSPSRWFRLYGDQGYSNTKYVSPYRANLSMINHAFNDYMKVPRASVEWFFGCISRNWDFVNCHLQSKLYLNEVEKVYIVAAILSNLRICLRPNILSSFFSVLPPTVEEYLN